ncbi:hypothetical protein CC2G_014335 [Coprinopsis cinerea AmutBmut pab1-1]|nr:hypothetical protein CC2G_014335 [Coprinopsis cinerea AmutBmut pab1-1]
MDEHRGKTAVQPTSTKPDPQEWKNKDKGRPMTTRTRGWEHDDGLVRKDRSPPTIVMRAQMRHRLFFQVQPTPSTSIQSARREVPRENETYSRTPASNPPQNALPILPHSPRAHASTVDFDALFGAPSAVCVGYIADVVY